MSDPQNFGLSELGQRVQAMGDPAPEPRLRPYQGGGGTAANGSSTRPTAPREIPSREIPAWEPVRENEKPITPAPSSSSPYPSFPGSYATPVIPASPEPYPPLGPAASPAASSFNRASNGSAASGTTGTTPASPSANPQAALPPPTSSDDPNMPKSGLQRAVDAVRSAIPLVQRLLPLLDGNFATAIGALVAPQIGHHHPPPPPPVPVPVQQVHVDLEPVERGLAEVRTSHRELRSQVVEQGASLKRVEDQLDRVREATDRNTLEQQELVEDLRAVGGRISTFAIIGLVLLAVSLGLNVYFLVQLQHILR